VTESVIGIIGGMGPEATLELFHRILACTPAQRDQDHYRILIDNNPKIPDRTAAILGHGADPLSALLASARTLQQAGASFLVMPCNTAHHWLPALRRSISIPILDMVNETAKHVLNHRPPLKTIGLLATTGTLKVELYQKALEEKGLTSLVPRPDEQSSVMEAIYRIKAGDYAAKDAVLHIAQQLIRRGAAGLVLGCTELSLIAKEEAVGCPLFDPLSILAREAVKWASGEGDKG